MEKTLEKGEDQIQKICDVLKKETLEPAKKEAQKIIEEAQAKAHEIVKNAHKQAESHLAGARIEIEKERSIFHSSLDMAGRQALEELRQNILNKFFEDELQRLVNEATGEPKIISKMIDGIMRAIEKEGLSVDISAVIPYSVSAEEVNHFLGDQILKKIRSGGVKFGEFSGGAQVTLHDKQITLDITDKTLVELLSGYVRKDFRKFLFQ